VEEGRSREEQLAQLEMQLQQERALLTGLDSMTYALVLMLYTYLIEYKCRGAEVLKCCCMSCVVNISNLAGVLCMLETPDLNIAAACSGILHPPSSQSLARPQV